MNIKLEFDMSATIQKNGNKMVMILVLSVDMVDLT